MVNGHIDTLGRDGVVGAFGGQNDLLPGEDPATASGALNSTMTTPTGPRFSDGLAT
jgi:hypothetical protein